MVLKIMKYILFYKINNGLRAYNALKYITMDRDIHHENVATF